MLSQLLDARRPPRSLWTPPYAVLRKQAGFEVRRYGPYAFAEADVADGFGGEGRAFGALAAGLGSGGAAMTTPVLSGPGLAMATGGSGGAGRRALRFALSPTDADKYRPGPGVRLGSEPEGLVAATRIGWREAGSPDGAAAALLP